MKKTLIVAAAVGGLALGSGGVIATQAAAGDSACKIKTTMGEEPLLAPGQTKPKGFRWVKTEEFRCGAKSITIVSYGQYQRQSPFN